MKLRGTGIFHLACKLWPQETVKKWEKSVRESSYVHNKGACFNTYIAKLQDIHLNVGVLHQVLAKGMNGKPVYCISFCLGINDVICNECLTTGN